MANFSNKIVTTIEVLTDKSAASLKSFRTSIQEADGASAKLKAGFGQAGDFIKSHAAGVAAAAGTALVGFAANAVSEFQNLALESGKMADTLGISTESASRWIEVAGDIGASTEDVTKAMTRMEREVAKNPAQFDALGISVARTATGAVDANETFLRTIEALKRIKDPTERQEAANKLLGRSWSNIAELVNGDVRQAYESVADAKLIDEEEVARAREFRDAWDELKGKLEDFTVTVGGAVVPLMTDMIDLATDLGAVFAKLKGPFDLLGEAFSHGGDMADKYIAEAKAAEEQTNGTGKSAEATAERMTSLARAFQDGSVAAEGTSYAIKASGEAAKEAERRLHDLEKQWDDLMGALDDESTWLSVQDGFDAVERAAAEAYEAAASGSADAEAKGRAYRQAVIEQTQAVLDYSKNVLGIPVSKATTIQALIDNGELERAEEALRILTRNREVSVQIVARGGVGYDGGISGKRAMGGPVSAGGLYEVNENGSELLTEGGKTYLMAGRDGMVTPLAGAVGAPSASSGSAAPVINIYANVIEKDTARWIVEQIAKARQTMGASTVQRAVNG